MLALIEGAANWRYTWGAAMRAGRELQCSWYPYGVTDISKETTERITAAWPTMCARLAAGDLTRDIYKAAGFSQYVISAYRLAHPGAAKAWQEARQASADALYDEAMDNARADVDKELAQHVRTRIDTLKWAARIRNPALYGDKAQLDVNVRTVDLTAIIRDANARLANANTMRVVNDSSGAQQDHTRAPALQIPALLDAAGLL